MKLEWKDTPDGPEAILGDFSDDNGVRFSINRMPTCYRRGQWRLLIEVEDRTHTWGCFDEPDQPMRYYHSLERLKAEAQAIADVLVADHDKKTGRVKKKRSQPESCIQPPCVCPANGGREHIHTPAGIMNYRKAEDSEKEGKA